MTVVGVVVGGALGSIVRYLLDLGLTVRRGSIFPWGTFVANLAGSMVLGLLTGVTVGAPELPRWIGPLVGAGFCGALTTYSTFGLETVRLAETGAWRYAVVNAAATVIAGLAAVTLGVMVGETLTG